MNDLLAQISIVNLIFVLYIAQSAYTWKILMMNDELKVPRLEGPVNYNPNSVMDAAILGKWVISRISDWEPVFVHAKNGDSKSTRTLFLLQYFKFDLVEVLINFVLGLMNIVFEFYLAYLFWCEESVLFSNFGLGMMIATIMVFVVSQILTKTKLESFGWQYTLTRYSGYAITVLLFLMSMYYLFVY